MRATLQRLVETLRPGLSQLPYLPRTLALVWDHISNLIHAKSTEVDLAFYDLPDYFDQLHRAQRDASYRPVALLQGLATLGDLALFYQAFSQGQRIARTLLENVGQIYNNMLFLGAFFEFLSLQPQVADPSPPAPSDDRSLASDRGVPAAAGSGASIGVHNVTFRYPGSQRTILDDLSLGCARRPDRGDRGQQRLG